MIRLRRIRLKVWMLLLLPILVALAIVVPREIDGWKNRRAARLEAQKYADWRDRYSVLIKAHKGPEPPTAQPRYVSLDV